MALKYSILFVCAALQVRVRLHVVGCDRGDVATRSRAQPITSNPYPGPAGLDYTGCLPTYGSRANDHARMTLPLPQPLPLNTQFYKSFIIRNLTRRLRPQSRSVTTYNGIPSRRRNVRAQAADGSTDEPSPEQRVSLPWQTQVPALPMTARVASTRKSKKSRAATGTELRRQRNREHQARYKTKQKNRVLDLENGIERLQQEIQELKLQRQIISIGVPGRQTKWGVAAEYFRLFRNGLRAPSRMNLPVGTVAAEFPVQRHFLQTTMTSDVVGSLGCGVDALLQNWRLITLCHPDVDIQLMRLQAGPGERVVAYTRGTHTITEDTLRYAFPHLNDGSNDSAWLASRLLGYKLVINGCTHLLWDADAGRMISISTLRIYSLRCCNCWVTWTKFPSCFQRLG